MSARAGTRTILHVDMDAFFVAVEVRRDPSLAGRPVVVGGRGPRGVVAAASYEARRYGIHSAMPSTQAQRRCPHAVFLPGDHEAYAAASREVHAILQRVTPLVEPIALDEAFLDVTGAHRRLGDGATIAWTLRRQIQGELRLPCSVGVGPTKTIAKLASEAAKPRAGPNGVTRGREVVVVHPDEAVAFLHAHPVRALWGVGPATLERLNRLGVERIGDLAMLDEATVVAALGRAHGRHLHQLARGIDDRPVVADREPKSIGHEETFATDRYSAEELRPDLVRLCDGVAARLHEAGLAGRTVQIKVRYGDFRTITRSTTGRELVDSGVAIVDAAGRLLAGIDLSPGVRLLGVSVSALGPPARQLSLLDEPAGVDGTVAEIRHRFGAGAIGPAGAMADGRLRVARRGAQQWGPEGSSGSAGYD